MDWLDKCECRVSYYKLCDDLFLEIIFVAALTLMIIMR